MIERPRTTTARASGTSTAPARPEARSWHALSLGQALAALGIDESGLSEAEAAARREAFGANVLPRARRAGVARIYLGQFKNPLVYLLLAATVVSLAGGEWGDAFFIFVVLQLNAAIGAYQDWRAETSAEALDILVGGPPRALPTGPRSLLGGPASLGR